VTLQKKEVVRMDIILEIDIAKIIEIIVLLIISENTPPRDPRG
jgi:hypothetical protein